MKRDLAEDERVLIGALNQQCRSLLQSLEGQDDVSDSEDLSIEDRQILQQTLGDLGVQIIKKLDKKAANSKDKKASTGEVDWDTKQGTDNNREKQNEGRDKDLRLLRSSTFDEEFSSRRKLVPISQWGLKFSGGGNMSVNAFMERVLELKDARNATDRDLWRYAIDFFEGEALIWYRANREYVDNWADLVTLLKRTFQRPFYQEELLLEINSRTQGLLDTGANKTVVNATFADTLCRLGLKSAKTHSTEISTADGQLILGKDFFDKFGIELQFKSEKTYNITEVNDLSLSLNKPAVISRDNLSDDQERRLSHLIKEIKQSISNKLGRTHILKHSIDTGNSKAIHQKQYNFSPVIKAAIEKELDDMLSKDVVEPSYSSWCSPVLIVKKPNGDNRLCLDSRLLNKITKRDTYPLPRVSSIIDNLRDAKYLSTIDLKSAFWQIELDESSKEKTAFAVPGRGQADLMLCPMHSPGVTI
ncbi:hypothetical protein MSG28_006484 [Choristoneura fumiferana]|uniref:Uncharacterized protein n=1 Tax=Choristoneura fumiferana TaxID=7141 RepID=A0ACC0JF54_CHOFU|nr:hypothetical protein MSG28_006484 [Choristoneura fumiferana]